MPDTIVANQIALPDRTTQALGVDTDDAALLKQLVRAGSDRQRAGTRCRGGIRAFGSALHRSNGGLTISRRLLMSRLAEADLEEIGDCIARDSRERPLSFVRELRDACALAAKRPSLYRRREDGALLSKNANS